MSDDLFDKLTQFSSGNDSFELMALAEIGVSRFMSMKLGEPELSVRRQTGVGAMSNGKPASRMAILPITGVISKYGSWYGSSSQQIGKMAREIMADGTVSRTLLLIDSPGGQVAGGFDGIAAVQALAELMPVDAYIQDCGCSLAYAFACAARRVFVNSTGVVGSIGTYQVVRDFSAMFAQAGVETHVVGAGDFKGMLTPGTKFTESQKAEIQRLITGLNAHFLATVERGRKLTSEQVKGLADGRVHVGQDAVKLGLADGVLSLEAAIEQLASTALNTTATSRNARPTSARVKMEAATFAQLKEALPKASAEFLCAQLEKGATVAQAQSAWTNELAAKLEEADKKAADEKKRADEAEAKMKAGGAGGQAHHGGAPDLSGQAKSGAAGGSQSSSDPIVAYEEKVREITARNVQSGMGDVQAYEAARQTVARSYPQMHHAFLEATNPSANGQMGLAARDQFTNQFRDLQNKAKAAS